MVTRGSRDFDRNQHGRTQERAKTNGILVTKKAVRNWEKQAVKPGNKAKQIQALSNLAECYCSGICVDQSDAKATAYWRNAAMLGDAMSEFNLSKFYDQGVGVEKNLEICGAARRQHKGMQWRSTILAFA